MMAYVISPFGLFPPEDPREAPNAGRECLHSRWAYRVTRCLHIGNEWIAKLDDEQWGNCPFMVAGTVNERGLICYGYEFGNWEEAEAALLDGSLIEFAKKKVPNAR